MPSTAAVERGDQLQYDFSISAGLYSQLAGVLAGFAFATLVALISGCLAGDSLRAKLAQSYRPFSATFLGLVATSLNYASVAGGGSNGGRTTSLGASAGISFVVSGIMLVYSISILLHAVEPEVKGRVDERDSADAALRASTLIDKVILLGACPMAVLLYSTAVRYHVLEKYGAESGLKGVDAFSLLASVLVFAFGMILLWKRSYLLHAVRAGTRVGRVVSALADNVLPSVAVAICILSVIATSLIVSFARPDDSLPDYVILAEDIVVTVFAFAVCVATAGRMAGETRNHQKIIETSPSSVEVESRAEVKWRRRHIHEGTWSAGW